MSSEELHGRPWLYQPQEEYLEKLEKKDPFVKFVQVTREGERERMERHAHSETNFSCVFLHYPAISWHLTFSSLLSYDSSFIYHSVKISLHLVLVTGPGRH